MAGVAALLGLPLFFEVGVVLLVPIVLLVARRTESGCCGWGFRRWPASRSCTAWCRRTPARWSRSTPERRPRPTLLFGLSVPSRPVICRAAFGHVLAKWVPVPAVAAAGGRRAGTTATDRARGPSTDERPRRCTRDRRASRPADRRSPLPVVLMLARGIAEIALEEGSSPRTALEVIGDPVVALLAGVLVAMCALGFRTGLDRGELSGRRRALPPIAGILLIVAAGGGFKQILVDAGVGK